MMFDLIIAVSSHFVILCNVAQDKANCNIDLTTVDFASHKWKGRQLRKSGDLGYSNAYHRIGPYHK